MSSLTRTIRDVRVTPAQSRLAATSHVALKYQIYKHSCRGSAKTHVAQNAPLDQRPFSRKSRFTSLGTEQVIQLGGFLAFTPSSEPPTLALAVAAAIGLPIALWVYKCIMMVIFQRRIIYMGYVPPNARNEQIGVDVDVPKGLSWEEITLRGEGRIRLAGILVRNASGATEAPPLKTLIVYLQGNAGSPLGRLPKFQKLLSSLPSDTGILAVAPRSYWKSSRRGATEQGLLSDYTSVLSYATGQYPSAKVILYGHSLGGTIAICLAARLSAAEYPSVCGLVVENPFASIPDMVKALYPQKWLPYHYLGALVLDRWDAVQAIETARPDSLLRKLSKNMMVLLSEHDELVPNSMGQAIFKASEKLAEGGEEGSRPRRMVFVKGALHEHAWIKPSWLTEMRRYVDSVAPPQRRLTPGSFDKGYLIV
ncbi:alpha/beta-hydrolase [Panus rudis PR-1116 ss-1]|nr:alpha/beta-hydrolase [Panus rudis PR-1116 ss-1]